MLMYFLLISDIIFLYIFCKKNYTIRIKEVRKNKTKEKKIYDDSCDDERYILKIIIL